MASAAAASWCAARARCHGAQLRELDKIGVQGVVGTLDDAALLGPQARAADAVINAASSDHRGAVEALVDALWQYYYYVIPIIY